ncbi:MAG: zinc-ribbon domain-containing protein [Lachnospiraceae bacterium]|nr:zinc-ribbon domain-containing protein [Lachnospiraceae bacterium]
MTNLSLEQNAKIQFCSFCGVKLDSEMNFCKKCGMPLRQSALGAGAKCEIPNLHVPYRNLP